MMPKSLRPTEAEGAPPSATNNGNSAGSLTDSGLAKISFFWKLMLCSQLMGLEGSVAFEQLYTVPLLQMLGMPLSLVSLTGLVEGSISIAMLPLIGWITDMGDVQRRKTIAIIVGAGLQVTGMTAVIIANVMHLTNLVNFNDNNTAQVPQEGLDGLPGSGTTSLNLSTVPATDSSTATRSAAFNSSSWVDTTLSYINFTEEDLVQSSGVPLKAGLGMFGFIVLSLGFDLMNSSVRSFLLACTPPTEHTSLLVAGLTMASVGGLATASMGILDFAKLFGLSSLFEGGGLVIQTSLQGALVSITVLLGLLVTTLSGRKHRKLTIQYQALPDSLGDDDVTSVLPHQEHLTRSSIFEAFESSIISGGVNFDPTLSLLSQSQECMPQKRRAQSNPEQTPLLSQENGKAFEDGGEFVQSHDSSLSYGPKESTYLCSGEQQQYVAKVPLEVVPENSELNLERSDAVACDLCCKIGFKAKITFTNLASFCGFSSVIMITMTGSDFVAKAIYGGDPEAPPGSDSAARYQDGMRAASIGFVVYYGTYLCISFVHPRILAKLGCRAEFVVAHVLTGMMLVLTALTQRLEVFYLLVAVSGFHRASCFAVPFALTNDVINARATATGGKVNLGLALATVMAMMPLAYCVIFTMVGPLEEYFNDVAVPIWMGAVSCCLASTFIILVGEV